MNEQVKSKKRVTEYGEVFTSKREVNAMLDLVEQETKRIAELHDFPDTSDCFPGLNIRGGVCYFLWDKEHKGDCKIIPHKNKEVGKPVSRPLLEKDLDVFIRYNEAINILKKVQKYKEKSFSEIVSARKPFGLATNFTDLKKNKDGNSNILLHRFGHNGFISKVKIRKNSDFINAWKVFIPYSSPGDDSYPHLILSKPIVAGKYTCCTETYLLIGPFDNEKKTKNVANYMTTLFFRFMILLAKSTQHITQKVYKFVPIQDFTQSWSDEKLYKKYGLSQNEIKFIESMIRPMELSNEK